VTEVGFALSSELFGPSELIDQAARAERAGFDFVAVSDHYHPWIPAQGESPFAWTTLGAVARATDDVGVGTGVTCPTTRYHPATLAQATATTAAMCDGRFFFGVGSGERLNEHVLGDHWPPITKRLAMLREAVYVIRALWRGEELTHDGDHYTVENARLFTLPDEVPPIYGSAYGPKAAKTVAEFSDGLYTVGPQSSVLDAYTDAGGTGPAYGQVSVCYEDSEERAIETVHDRWPISMLPGELNSQLATPAQFEQASQLVSKDDVTEGSIVTDPAPSMHVEQIQGFVDAGFDHVVVHQVGTDLDSFFETYETEVLPEVS